MKLKFALLILGVLITSLHNFVVDVTFNFQIIFFLTGVVLFGIPHGAADVLVGNTNSTYQKSKFSLLFFLGTYLLRLIAFSVFIWLLPSLSLVVFIFLAAYHFGETDLHFFSGKKYVNLFYFAYGLTIIGGLILLNLNDVIPLVNLIRANQGTTKLLEFIKSNRLYILFSFAAFYCFVLFLFIKNNKTNTNTLVQVNLVLLTLIFICSALPLFLGFTFYFVIWHSTLSLKNIFQFICTEKSITKKSVAKHISLYSAIALIGISIVGTYGFMFNGFQSIAVYLFMGLAVLTGPHMDVMHTMYSKMKTS